MASPEFGVNVFGISTQKLQIDKSFKNGSKHKVSKPLKGTPISFEVRNKDTK